MEVEPTMVPQSGNGLCHVFTETVKSYGVFFRTGAAVVTLFGVFFRLWETAIVSMF